MSVPAQTLIEKIQSDFEKEVAGLWNKENYYKKFLEETGMSLREALLKKQGYSPIIEKDKLEILISLATEYIRIGRHDIANLFTKLQNPEFHVAVFTEAQQKYYSNPDYYYGSVLSYCLSKGLGNPG